MPPIIGPRAMTNCAGIGGCAERLWSVTPVGVHAASRTMVVAAARLEQAAFFATTSTWAGEGIRKG